MDIRYRKRTWTNIDGTFHQINVSFGLNIDMDYYHRLHQLTKIKSVIDISGFVRVGNANDGGYVMLDDWRNPEGKEKIAYSFGINDDVSWDDGIADRGYTVYMYDPTITSLPKQRKEFRFFQKGIAGQRCSERKLDTLEHLMVINGHLGRQHMILKMDVEGYEWEFLETVDENLLMKFDQILLELHDITSADSAERKLQKLHALEKLNRTHQLIHLHGNNFDGAIYLGDCCIPNVLEATYVSRKEYALTENTDIVLPIDLDAPNSPFNEELVLGHWNDVRIDAGAGIRDLL